MVGRPPLRLSEKSRAREYSAPRFYEIAFELNRKGEVDFLVHCFKRFSRRPVRRVVERETGHRRGWDDRPRKWCLAQIAELLD